MDLLGVCPPIFTKTCRIASHCNSVAALFHFRVLKLSANNSNHYFRIQHILSYISSSLILYRYFILFHITLVLGCLVMPQSARGAPQILAHLDPFSVAGAAAATVGRNAGGGLLFCGQVLCGALRRWDFGQETAGCWG